MAPQDQLHFFLLTVPPSSSRQRQGNANKTKNVLSIFCRCVDDVRIDIRVGMNGGAD